MLSSHLHSLPHAPSTSCVSPKCTDASLLPTPCLHVSYIRHGNVHNGPFSYQLSWTTCRWLSRKQLIYV